MAGTLLSLIGHLLVMPQCIEKQVPVETVVPGADEYFCLTEIRERLKPDEAMVEYQFTDSIMLIAVISHEAFAIIREKLDPWFWGIVKTFRRNLRSADIREFVSASRILYSWLMAPLSQYVTGKRRLIVIPDCKLAGIPFEALISEANSSSRGKREIVHYLVCDYEITYNYSSMLWVDSFGEGELRHYGGKTEPDYEFTGFSPVFSGHSTLNPLPDSRNEVATIGSMFVKKGLISYTSYDNDSRKSRFKEVACRSRILHIATHSLRQVAGHPCCGVLFWGYDPACQPDSLQDGVLTTTEIGELNLNAELIVLNACSSGLGQPEGGMEGVPLPMNFIRAGARNILSSLWNVTDRLAGNFMVGFYRNRLAGETYSAALRKIKLELLGNPGTSLPIVWAPYVMYGQ